MSADRETLLALSKAEYADDPGSFEYIRAASECYRQYRSGSLIPRSEYERVLALLAEARATIVETLWAAGEPSNGDQVERYQSAAVAARATLSRIDDALAAQPEARR